MKEQAPALSHAERQEFYFTLLLAGGLSMLGGILAYQGGLRDLPFVATLFSFTLLVCGYCNKAEHSER